MPIRTFALAVTLIIVLLTAGGTVVSWQLAQIDKRLDERLAIYHKQIDEMYRRIERLENAR